MWLHWLAPAGAQLFHEIDVKCYLIGYMVLMMFHEIIDGYCYLNVCYMFDRYM